MPEERQGASLTTVFSVCFTVIAIVALFALVVVKSRADVSTQEATLFNAAPTATINNGDTSQGAMTGGVLNLVENTVTSVFVYGTVTDTNGCNDINDTPSSTIRLYREDGNGRSNCLADANDCYVETNIVYTNCGGVGDNIVDFEKEFSVQYYADATDAGDYVGQVWQSTIKASDASLAMAEATSATFTLNSLASLNLSGNINYGSMALNATTADPGELVTITNTGNRSLQAAFKATGGTGGDMTCTGSGSNVIPAGNTHISLTSGFVYASGTALTTSDQNLSPTLPQRTSGVVSDDVFFKLQIPESGVGGTCTNSVTFTASAI